MVSWHEGTQKWLLGAEWTPVFLDVAKKILKRFPDGKEMAEG